MKEFFKKLGGKLVGRRGIGNTMTVVIIIAVVLLNILAYTITNAFGLYLYSPDQDDFSISGNTDELFADAITLGKKVTITFCYAEDKLEKHDTGRLVLKTARAFAERYPEFIELKFVNLLTKMDADGKIVDLRRYCDVVCSNETSGAKCSERMRFADVNQDNPRCRKCGATLDLKEDVVYGFKQSSVIFETGSGSSYSYRVLTDRATAVGFSDFYTLDTSANVTSYNGEEVMAAMISWVTKDTHPVVYFTQNHGESADVSFSNLLTCAGYYVEAINLRKSEIPENAGMIVISNPTSDFELSLEDSDVRGEINKIEDYLERGGKLYVALDPYVKKLTNLEDLIGRWGISLSGETNEHGVLVRNIIRENSEAITPDGYTFIATHAKNDVSDKILDKVVSFGNDSILVREIASLTLDSSLGANPLLVASGTASTHAGGNMTDSNGGYTVAAYSKRQEADGKESTVLVLPTIYITANDAFLSQTYSNKDFLYATLEVLFDSNSAPYGCNRVTYKSTILENLTMGRAKLYTAIILTIPAAITVAGTVIIKKRKNR